ncbi:hypothetical protein ACN09C_18130 [Serratia fonticola]|uniref:hypothetical protein n=1 Tax=Serratia fonticola TaxID=47917 RepID=UPI003B00DB4C
MDKTETNIAIARLAIDFLQIAQAHGDSSCYEGLEPPISHNAPPIEAFDAIYAYLLQKLTEAQ